MLVYLDHCTSVPLHPLATEAFAKVAYTVTPLYPCTPEPLHPLATEAFSDSRSFCGGCGEGGADQ